MDKGAPLGENAELKRGIFFTSRVQSLHRRILGLLGTSDCCVSHPSSPAVPASSHLGLPRPGVSEPCTISTLNLQGNPVDTKWSRGKLTLLSPTQLQIDQPDNLKSLFSEKPIREDLTNLFAKPFICPTLSTKDTRKGPKILFLAV